MEQERGNIFPASLFLFAFLLVSGVSFPSFPAEAAGALSPVKEQPKPSSGASQVNSIVTELNSLSVTAEQIFNLALVDRIDSTGKKMNELKRNAVVFNYIKDAKNDLLLPRLDRTIAALENALSSKNRFDTMRYANRITLIIAVVTVPFNPIIPTEVSLLEYNGRELEIWSERKNMNKLSNTVIRMHLAWQTLMPKLIEHNGLKTLKHFSEVMEHLEFAKTPEEYSRLSRQALIEAEASKAIFAKATK